MADLKSCDEQLDSAAKVIQRNFRGYRARREMDGYELNASNRWISTVKEAQFRASTRPLSKGSTGSTSADQAPSEQLSSARQSWKKVSTVARRVGRDETDSESDLDPSDLDEVAKQDKAAKRLRRSEEKAKRKQDARQMGLQYFLEMVDTKHRYGSNLRIYHEEWKRSHTQDNFFHWLDHGDGSRIEMEMCPRDRLEREQVRYLTKEERQFYLVKIDSEGRLCWTKNGARIDTSEQYKDSIHGIVPANDPTPAYDPKSIAKDDDDDNDDDDNADVEDDDSSGNGVSGPQEDNKPLKKINHISTSSIVNRLLQKSVPTNTWIFVADTSFRLYVGIKNSGAFQHSSFLQGGRISAAGLIRVKNGRLKLLSPLSGHYKPPSSNFKAFIKNLKAENVDMSKMTISKSYAVLLGLEAYAATRDKSKSILGKIIPDKTKTSKKLPGVKEAEEANIPSESMGKLKLQKP
ncbi:hypothetical protein VHEMI03717 [[Torrubiella] hemipterigena]|uniref:IQ calmodulin-binding motif protein n=1 Tax=[Torrubiella] hemipterigena TaxID=1531966 RepID=A0A0A1TC49_9HYPO|nr:hypothetical protein VHEMI03717 [[Torrubiella] hemipterigena]